jgi:1-deoxy-D-xylulose-5-phosphate reductoisomerase
MGIPILYAFTYPERLPVPSARLDLTRKGALTFFEPDLDKFPCVRLARTALDTGGVAPVVLNAANEIAVAAFLDRRIRFTAIAELIERALAAMPSAVLTSIEQCVAVDVETRRRVQAFVDAGIGKR